MRSLDLAVPGAKKWAETSEGRAEVVEVVDQARGALFVPGFWDVTAPLWDTFDAMAAGETTAHQGLQEAAPIMQETLDRSWETWEAIT